MSIVALKELLARGLIQKRFTIASKDQPVPPC